MQDGSQIDDPLFNENYEITLDGISPQELYKAEDFNDIPKDDSGVFPSSLMEYLLPCILDKDDLEIKNTVENSVCEPVLGNESKSKTKVSPHVSNNDHERTLLNLNLKGQESEMPSVVTISVHDEPTTNTVRVTADVLQKSGTIGITNEISHTKDVTFKYSTNEIFTKLLDHYESLMTSENVTLHVRKKRSNISYECSECSKCFKKQISLEQHILKHSNSKGKFQCDECKKYFKSEQGLRRHSQGDPGSVRYECPQCGKTYPVQAHYELHLQQHGNLRPYSCSRCKKSFRSTDYLRLHRRKYCNENSFQCPWCEKSFTNERRMDVHIKMHKGERPFKCAECMKYFSGRGELNIHLRIHRGERPFKCPYCDKTFRMDCTMKVHQQKHDIKHPFPCTKCDRSFVYQSHLAVHLRSHNGERPFKCPDCDRSFVQSHHLQRHFAHVHEPRSRYQCSKCSKNYIWPSDFKKHLRTHNAQTVNTNCSNEINSH